MLEQELRDKILADPSRILDDRDIMAALVGAHDQQLGSNVIDLRGAAMEKLEDRLYRLEDTHRSVIAAAYENLAGTNQVHRAILQMLDPLGFEDFLKNLSSDVADTLRVDCIRLVLETRQSADDPALARVGDVVHVADPGFIAEYLTLGRDVPQRMVTLRPISPAPFALYGEKADWIRSEALMKLDFGQGRLPGLLVMGSEDPHLFKPSHGTDLLAFFAGVFERAMRKWLS